jgi:hypothetical protein
MQKRLQLGTFINVQRKFEDLKHYKIIQYLKNKSTFVYR